MQLFKLPTMFVKDSDLGAVMRLLEGKVYTEGQPVPVRDTQLKGGRVKANGQGGSAPEVVLREIVRRKLKQVTRKDIVAVLADAGIKSWRQPGNVVTKLLERKILKRVKIGVYKVVSHG